MKRRDFLKLAMTTTAATWALPACQAVSQEPSTASPQPSPLPTIPLTTKPTQVPITLYGSEMWNMIAKSNRQEYRILTSSPRAKNNAPLPVIYITDGNGNLPLLYVLHSTLVDDGYLPPALLVGVDYPFDVWSDYEGLRARDFTPTILPSTSPYAGAFKKGSGGAALFLQFLRDELKPVIDSKYNTLPDDATLTGHSLGGLLALYALFESPSPFRRYVIGSPSIYFDNKAILNRLETFASTHTDLPARVFMGVGGNESFMVTDMQALAETLTNYKYPNLKLSTRVFEEETHLSMIPFFLSMGLRAVFGS